MNNSRVNPAGGFTLLEVLIALAVLALALAAIIGTAGSSTRAAANLRDKTYAHWVAMNQVTEVRIAHEWPATGTSDGDSEMAERRWHWRMRITPSANQNIRRINVDVFAAQNNSTPVTSLTAFVAKPPPEKSSKGKNTSARQGAGAQNHLPQPSSNGGLP